MKFSQFWPELPFPASSIQSAFSNLYERHTGQYSSWSITASRRKMVADFWLKILLNHFTGLIVLALVVQLMVAASELSSVIKTFFPFSMVIFGCLYLTMYWPVYHFEFLPHLDACVDNFHQQRLEGIQQCKKEQYSVLSLMLIQHVLQELSGIKQTTLNTEGAQILARQYGVSVKSILPALQLIYRGDWNRDSIRKRTEIIDDLDIAKGYFTRLQEPRAILLLEKIQYKILH